MDLSFTVKIDGYIGVKQYDIKKEEDFVKLFKTLKTFINDAKHDETISLTIFGIEGKIDLSHDETMITKKPVGDKYKKLIEKNKLLEAKIKELSKKPREIEFKLRPKEVKFKELVEAIRNPKSGEETYISLFGVKTKLDLPERNIGNKRTTFSDRTKLINSYLKTKKSWTRTSELLDNLDIPERTMFSHMKIARKEKLIKFRKVGSRFEYKL